MTQRHVGDKGLFLEERREEAPHHRTVEKQSGMHILVDYKMQTSELRGDLRAWFSASQRTKCKKNKQFKKLQPKQFVH